MEDPFVLRLALNVTRRQLWDLQNKGVKILYLILRGLMKGNYNYR